MRYTHSAMFVTFEGPDGAGKTTLIRQLAAALEAQGHTVCVTREPGDGPLGPTLREMILGELEINSETELLLFLADRAQHADFVIRPAAKRGEIVLSDRFGDSTVVYQGYARGHDINWLKQLNAFATRDLVPDISFLLDIDPEVGLSRVTDKNRLDAEALDFHVMVRNGFLTEAQNDPNRWIVLDASKSSEEVFELALDNLLKRLEAFTARQS